jgi:hypothetical protein
MESASKSIPIAVSPQPSKSNVITMAADVITQRDLIDYRFCARELSEARTALREKREAIFNRLRAGALVEEGLKTVRIVSIARGRKVFERLFIDW